MMKKFLTGALVVALVISAIWALNSYDQAKRSAWNRIKDPATVQMLKRFVAMKKAQAYAATDGVPPEFETMFKYGERGDFESLSNSIRDLKERIDYQRSWNSRGGKWHGVRGLFEDFISATAQKIGQHWEPKAPPRLDGTPGQEVREISGALEAFVTGDEKYSTGFGREIIDSIPPGSVYFADTDPGEFIVTAMCKSQPEGDPFFTIDQAPLSYGSYLDHLRSMYGAKIYIPTVSDTQACFNEYADRARNGSLGTPGVVGVLEISGMLARIIFEQNTNREFFVEEGYPTGWMQPYLEPHGLILKLNREPLAGLGEAVTRQDRDFWCKSLKGKIGDWLVEETPVEAVADFSKKIFRRHDLTGFTGDPRFVENDYSCKMFSRERAVIGGLYAWRAEQSTNDFEKQRMTREADFAFRQAVALCPYSSVAVFRYINFLVAHDRFGEAILIVDAAAEITKARGGEDDQFRQVVGQIIQFQTNKPAAQMQK